MVHYLYKITNLLNKKYYIGVHSTNDLEEDDYRGSGKILRRAYKKYDIYNFTFEILEYFDNKIEMMNKEREIVNEDFIQDKKNYNLALGGGGGNLGPKVNSKLGKSDRSFMQSKTYKDKMSESTKGEKNGMYGKRHTKESKKNMGRNRRSYKGKENPNWGGMIYTPFGTFETIQEIAILLNVSYACIWKRLKSDNYKEYSRGE